MKIKVKDASELVLDYLVGTCEDKDPDWPGFGLYKGELWSDAQPYSPTSNWAQGGPIIEREQIRLRMWNKKRGESRHGLWCAGIHNKVLGIDGPTPLIAAMRCYVASKLGDEVEIPDELLSET